MMKLLAFTKMHAPKHQDKPNTVTTESKPNATGMKMLTYAQMRAHKHTENPCCACHDVEAILALVPEDQQSQFVRIYPRPQPRYAKYPTGVSMFREELDMEMTVPRQDSAQQPRPSLDSMVMAPVATEGYTGNRGSGNDQKQFCMPQVVTVVSSFFAQARKAVRFEPTLPSTPVDNLPAVKDHLLNPSSETVLEDVSKSQPSPRVTVRLQRCNAVRYRTDRRPRLQPHVQKDTCLGRHHPGGEADSYYLSDPVAAQQPDHAPIIKKPSPAQLSRKQSVKGATIPKASRERSACHPTRPDSPFPRPQQRTKLPGKSIKKVCKHQRHDAAPVSSPQTHMHLNKATDEPRLPPLRGTKKVPSMADMPGLPPPVHRDGHLPWQDLSTLRIAPGPALPSTSSSRRNYAATEFDIPDHVPDDTPEAIPTPLRFSLKSVTSVSQSPHYPATEASVLDDDDDDVSNGIPEAIPASQRFSLDDFIPIARVPASNRFSISDSDSETFEPEPRLSIDSRFSVGSSSTHQGDYDYEYDADAENGTAGNEQSASSDTLEPELRVMRRASICTLPVPSFLEKYFPSLGYYEYAVSSVPPDPQDNDQVLERYHADNMDLYVDVTSPVDTHSESDTDFSIDQSLFANFNGVHFGTGTGTGTSTPSLTSDTETSPPNSCRSRSDKGTRLSSLEGIRHPFQQSLGKPLLFERARTFEMLRSNSYWID